MPREPRVYIENALYLVTAKGHEDRDLFSDHQDYLEYLMPLRQCKKEYGFKLFAFSLLPKSLCLLVELRNNVTISTIMHNLNSGYTKSYNSRYGTKGHLFQSRFKSVLIEKEDYLPRLTRYIHLLARGSQFGNDGETYPYDSYTSYVSDQKTHDSEAPDMHEEISEVLGYFSKGGNEPAERKAYEHYVSTANDEELEQVRKLLHRKAFVGSPDFIAKMRKRVKDHITEEEKSRTIRKSNPTFVIAGGLVIIFLGVVSYSFYVNQTTLQETLNTTADGFGIAREDLATRVNRLENVLTDYESKENHGLGDFAWEVRLTPVQQEKKNQSYVDRLHFKGGKVISAKLMSQGFSPFDYTLSKQTHGKMIWETTQTNTEGAAVRWYGIIAGDQMRGVFSESLVSGENRDFSFVSIERVHRTGSL